MHVPLRIAGMAAAAVLTTQAHATALPVYTTDAMLSIDTAQSVPLDNVIPALQDIQRRTEQLPTLTIAVDNPLHSARIDSLDKKTADNSRDVPLPGTAWLLGACALGLAGIARHRNRSR